MKGSIRPQKASHEPIDEQGKKADRGVTVDLFQQTVVNRLDKQVTFQGSEKVRHRALTDHTGLLVTVTFDNSQIVPGARLDLTNKHAITYSSPCNHSQ